MKKSLTLAAVLAVCLALFFAASSIQADTKTTVDDVIKMETKIYTTHERGIVEFTHKKHVEDYEIGCGECHHDAEGKPLNDLKMGDPVQSCAECHSKPGELKGEDARGKSKQEKLEYHAAALHENCIECHKEFNKKHNVRTAPTTCTRCHPRQ